MAEMQYRTSHELRADSEGPGFSGYASHFGSVDSYVSVVKRGAFKKTLNERGDRIPLLFNHDSNAVIGRFTELKEDATGLKFNARVSETSLGTDILKLLRDDVPLGMSFGFQTIKARTATDEDDIIETEYSKGRKRSDIEIIEEVKLYEASAVTFPANELAPIQNVRKMAELDHLDTILNAIREGSADEGMLLRASQIVEAMQAGAGESTPLEEPEGDTPPVRSRARDIDVVLALMRGKQYLRA